MNYRKFLTLMLTVFIAFAFIATPAIATRYENLNVSNLSVEKTLRVNGLLQAVANTTGNVWYVHSETGVDGVGAAGKSSLRPFATLDFAIGMCTANNNDFIIVMAGHEEELDAANGWDADVAGITILGLGYGTDMPTFTFTATDSTVAIGAADVSVYNLRFLPGISAVVIGIAVEADGTDALLSDLVFPEATITAYEFVDGIDLEALVAGLTVQNTTYFNADLTGAAHFIEMGNGVNTDIKLLNNYVYGEFSVSAVWSNDVDLEILIKGGTYTNLTNGEHAIEFTGAATGQIIDVLTRTNAQGTAVDPGSMTMDNVRWDDDTTADTVAIPVVAVSVAERSLQRATGTLPAGTAGTIFTVAGGPIEIVSLVGEVTINIEGKACNLKVSADPTTGTATDLAANLAISGDAAGTFYSLQTSIATALQQATNGVDAGMDFSIIVPVGIITITTSATNTGSVSWYIRYKPLAEDSVVTAN